MGRIKTGLVNEALEAALVTWNLIRTAVSGDKELKGLSQPNQAATSRRSGAKCSDRALVNIITISVEMLTPCASDAVAPTKCLVTIGD